MLREWLTSLTTPASRAARRYGYLREAIAIEARHRRCAAAWAEHLRQTRRFIGWAAEDCAARRKAVVFGSGALLDVPLETLAEDFREVILVDMVHPKTARQQAKKHANVRLLEANLTGLIGSLGHGGIPLEPPAVELPEADADFAVSLNLLTQLPLLPLDHVPAEDAMPFARAVMSRHLEAVRKLPGQVCLICENDRQWVECDLIEEREDPLLGLELPPPEKTWLWDLAPAPEFHPRRSVRLRVAAYADFQ